MSEYPVCHNLSADLAVFLYKGVRYGSGVDHSLRERKVRDSCQEVVSVAQRTPAVLCSEQNVKFSYLNRIKQTFRIEGLHYYHLTISLIISWSKSRTVSSSSRARERQLLTLVSRKMSK